MLKNYFNIAWRNIVRHKGYSFINIAGLATGIAVCLLLFVVVKYELSYDTFHANAKNIYRLVTKNTSADGTNFEEGITNPATDALRIDLPQVKKITEVYTNYGGQIAVINSSKNGLAADKKFTEDTGLVFIDPEYFSIFNSNWIAGTPAVLDEPNTVVIDKRHAIKYFGDWKNVIGRELKMDNTLTLKVAGIIEDCAPNTDFPMQVMVSFITLKHNPQLYSYESGWGASVSNHQVLMLLPENVTAASINDQLIPFVKKHFDTDKDMVMNMKKTLFLQPLKDIHFDKRFGNLGDHETSKTTLWTLSLIGAFILLMASINFINLSTVQAAGRSKEMGIRKVLGGNRGQLIVQSMGETALIVFFAVLSAIFIAKLTAPFLKYIADAPATIKLINSVTITFLAITGIVITFLSGLYPALVVSGFKPVLALKNKISAATIGGISMRRVLVVAQFAISQVLITGTIVAVAQMRYVRTADLGFNKDAVLILDNINFGDGLAKMNALKLQLQQVPAVKSVSFTSDPPSSTNNWSTDFYFDNSMKDLGFGTDIKMADAGYFKTFQLHFLAGQGYEASDSTKRMVINETLLHKLGMTNPHDAIGKTIRIGSHGPWSPIVGVVQDFKTNSFRQRVSPVVIFSQKEYYARIGVKLQPQRLAEALPSIQAIWQKTFPDFVYEPRFLDERIAAFYKQENQMELLFKIFAGIAIFISCLGLYGLVSFMAIQKTKEVGVRKVLGASVRSIVYLFSKEFTLLVIIAFAIAAPIAWWLMQSWLQNFVYHIPLGISVFAFAIIASLVIALATVSYKAITAALANPVKSLRSE